MKTITLTLYEISEKLPEDGQRVLIFDFRQQYGWMCPAVYCDNKAQAALSERHKCLIHLPVLDHPQGYFTTTLEPNERRLPEEVTHWMAWLGPEIIEALREFQSEKAKQELHPPFSETP